MTPRQFSFDEALKPNCSAEQLRLWRAMERSYQGGEQFKQAYLWRHEREDDEDWLQRLKRAVYENYLRDLISRREAILFGRRISRSIQSDRLPWDKVAPNIDGKNNGWEAFIRKCFVYSQLFGFAAVVIDSNRFVGSESASNTSSNRVPVLRLLHPQRLINWERDSAGNFRYVTIQESSSGRSRLIIDAENVYRFTNDRCDSTGIVADYSRTESFKHGLGTVPILILSDLDSTDASLGKPSLQSAAELGILYFNQSNWYDQLLYKTNYSTLAATPFASSHEEREMVVGSGDVFWVPDGGMMPAWISPDTAPADVFERRLAYMRRRMYELAALDVGHVEDKTRDLSGMAYSVRRLPTEEMALRLSRKLKSFEEQLIGLIYRSAGLPVEVDIKYPIGMACVLWQMPCANWRASNAVNCCLQKLKPTSLLR
jgi:hypothetical protein